jgi:hypothetical protein
MGISDQMDSWYANGGRDKGCVREVDTWVGFLIVMINRSARPESRSVRSKGGASDLKVTQDTRSILICVCNDLTILVARLMRVTSLRTGLTRTTTVISI